MRPTPRVDAQAADLACNARGIRGEVRGMRRRLERQFVRFRRTGDPACLAEVFDRAGPEVLRIAMHFATQPAEAEDLLQRTFLSAIESAERYDESQRLVPWLLGILSNHVKDVARSRHRRVDPTRFAPREVADPVDVVERRESLDLASDAVARMPEPVRTILVLRFRHGLEPVEIADALGMLPATVRSHLHRGLHRLRRTLTYAGAAFAMDGDRLPRGLDDVRRVVVERAREVGPTLAATSGVMATASLGGLLMKKSVLVAGAALLLAGAALSFVEPTMRSGSAPVRPPATASVDAEGGPQLGSDQRSSEVPAWSSESDGQADATERSKTALLVRVRDPAGRPAEGVGVMLVPGGRLDAGVPRLVTTDADGQVLASPRPGRTLAWIDRGGGKYVDVIEGVTTVVDLQMKRGVRIEGTVVTSDGQPVEGATVRLGRDQRTRSLAAPEVATTDRTGRFFVEHVESGMDLWASAAGKVPSDARRVFGRAGDVEAIRLVLGGAGHRLDGTVVDADGNAVMGATVWVGNTFPQTRTLPDGTQGQEPGPPILSTNGDGAFSADGLATGPHFVTVRAVGHGHVRTVVNVTDGAPSRTRIALPRPASIVGRVTEGSGRPAAATVWIGSGSDPVLHRGIETDAEGRYRIEDAPRDGDHPLRFQGKAGRAERQLGILREGEISVLDVQLVPGRRIRVSVANELGVPLSQVRVRVRAPSDVFGGQSALTDVSGSAGLDVDVPGPLVAEAVSEGVLAYASAELEAPAQTEVSLVVREVDRPSARIRGRADPSVVGLRVSLLPVFGRIAPALEVDASTGAFQSPLLSPGEYALSARSPEHGDVPLGTHTLGAGQTLDVGSVPLDAPGSLVVRARRASDRSPVACFVRATSEWGTVNGTLDESGVSRFARVRPGTYRVVAVASGDRDPAPAAALAPASASVTISSGQAATLELELPPGFARRLQLEPMGHPTSNVVVTIRREGEPTWLYRSIHDGAMVASLPGDLQLVFVPGRYVASVRTQFETLPDVVFEVRGSGEPPVLLPTNG